jgi:hypothetical protein
MLCVVPQLPRQLCVVWMGVAVVLAFMRALGQYDANRRLEYHRCQRCCPLPHPRSREVSLQPPKHRDDCKGGGGKRCARDCWRIRDPALLASAPAAHQGHRAKAHAGYARPAFWRKAINPRHLVVLFISGDDDVGEFVVRRFFLIQDLRSSSCASVLPSALAHSRNVPYLEIS